MDKLTITLTGRPPVCIVKDIWPILASAKDWDNTHESRANRTWKLIVRRHADGRAIVYGIHTSNYQHEPDIRGGELLAAGDNIAESIFRVAERLGFTRRLADECIADLPAEEVI